MTGKAPAANTLDRWFMVGDKYLPTYFYVDWSQPAPRAEWLMEAPSRVNYKQTIRPREFGQGVIINVVGYTVEGEAPRKPPHWGCAPNPEAATPPFLAQSTTHPPSQSATNPQETAAYFSTSEFASPFTTIPEPSPTAGISYIIMEEDPLAIDELLSEPELDITSDLDGDSNSGDPLSSSTTDNTTNNATDNTATAHPPVAVEVVDDFLQPLPVETKYSNISFLKSHLQKCIRRQKADLAVRTAYHMMRLDPGELLRRLPVIMVEDTTLHESIGLIVWLMCAVGHDSGENNTQEVGTDFDRKAGYQLTVGHAKIIANIVAHLCGIKYADRHTPYEDTVTPAVFSWQEGRAENSTTNGSKNRSFQLRSNWRSLAALPTCYSYSLLSMLIRLSYGGLKCDMELLSNMIHLWWSRAKNPANSGGYAALLTAPISVWGSWPPPPLKLRDWLLEGIDYHCASYLLDWTLRYYPTLTLEQIKLAIWVKRSAINTRICLVPGEARMTPPIVATRGSNMELNMIWNKIKYTVERNSAYILKHYH